MARLMGWVCARCNSTDLRIAVEWCDSLERVDQAAAVLEPADCDPEAARIVTGFCDSCGAQGDAQETIIRGEATGIRPPATPA